ncbi:RNA pyrophosphohydrolase [Candidatus Paracaedimonas acanthamoebae]|nr:RNA pyrophosphohydrolase [Candidatus Paracaedimonas acanthamoebae]
MKHTKKFLPPYRNGVGVMLLNKENKVFVARRIVPATKAWQMPQGGIDEGETPETAAFRELKEEIGTNNVQILAASHTWHTYDFPPYLIGKLWGGNYRGQRQKWFLMRFLGEDTEINIATEHPEFCDWQWIRIEELPVLAISFKRKTYQALIDEFSSVIEPNLIRIKN